MREKSHTGERHKGCGLCDQEKRAGNAADRRPARDRRRAIRRRADVGTVGTLTGDARSLTIGT